MKGMKGKLIVFSIIVSVIFVIFGAFSYYLNSKTINDYQHVARVNFPRAVMLHYMSSSVKDLVRQSIRLGLLDRGDKVETEKIENAMKSAMNYYEKYNRRYQEIPFVEGERELYDLMNNGWKDVQQLSLEALDKYKQNTDENLITFLNFKYRKTYQKYFEDFDNLFKFQELESESWDKRSADTAQTGARIMFAAVVFFFVTALAVGVYFAVDTSRRVEKAVKDVSSVAVQVESTSGQISAASQDVSSGAQSSASRLQETVAAVEELSSIVKTNANHASAAAQLSTQSAGIAQDGEREIRGLILAMTEIAESSKRIEEIINVIDDIAFQTNLLALNAAVEAARAGEQGKGFAVVAEAVRSLAQRSSSAAKDISQLIHTSVEKTDRGALSADRSGEVLKKIVDSIQKMNTLNNEISAASQQQSDGISQISQALNDIDHATQKNASSSEELSSTSEAMNAQSQELKTIVHHLALYVSGKNAA